jgi:hypothetical protein
MVTNTNDSGPGSLRAVIASAQPGDVITLNVAGTISLSSTVEINKSVTIKGPGAANLALDGNNSIQILSVTTGQTVSVSGITVQNANTTNFYFGGAILNFGTLTLKDIVAVGNIGSQGAILNVAPGVLTLVNSSLYGNAAGYYGGGLENAGIGGQVTIIGSTISNNFAQMFGGGIFNADGPMTIINSTIANNTSGWRGGGLDAGGDATSTLINVTIAGNSAANGGGIYHGLGQVNSGLTLKNTLLAGNVAIVSGGNCELAEPIVSAGHNLSDDGSCALSSVGDKNNVVAGLDPAGLTDNGGTTATIGLLTNSAALEAVPVAPTNYCTLADGLTPITTDQRGVFRPQGRACDIGAFEAVLPDDDSAYSQLSGGNTFTGNQTVNGSVSATTFVGDGSALTGVGKITTVTAGSGLTGGGSTGNISLAVDSTVARTNVSNTFTGNQSVSGSVTANSLVTSGTISIGNGTSITKHLSLQSPVSFPALNKGMCATTGISATGVADGDTVVLTGSNSLMQAAGGIPMYTAWVSAANVIQIRACNVDANTGQKAGVSGTVRLDIWKH